MKDIKEQGQATGTPVEVNAIVIPKTWCDYCGFESVYLEDGDRCPVCVSNGVPHAKMLCCTCNGTALVQISLPANIDGHDITPDNPEDEWRLGECPDCN